MPPLGKLADFQCYDCQICPGCCRRGWIVPVTDDERRAITAQGWSRKLESPTLFLPYRVGVLQRGYRLAQDETGSCVFLNPENSLCRIHEQHGFGAKPLACQAYPHVFVPADDRVEVSLRFDCLSVATNHGRPLARQQRELRALARRVVGRDTVDVPAPPLRRGVRLPWSDLRLVAGAFESCICDTSRGITGRILACLTLTELLREVRFKRIQGERVGDLVGLLAADAPAQADQATSRPRTPPARAAAVLFRQLAAIYTRHDRLIETDRFRRRMKGAWQRFKAARRFARGRGSIPRLQDVLPQAAFDDLEFPLVAIPGAVQEALARFYRLQLTSLRFFGRGCYGQDLLSGAMGLWATYPVLLWLARWFAHGAGRQDLELADIHSALRVVGHQYAQSPALGTFTERRRLDLLAQQGMLESLVLWYG